MVSSKPSGHNDRGAIPGLAALRRVLSPAMLLIGLAIAGLVLRELPVFRHLLQDLTFLRQSQWGRVVFIGGGVLYCAFGLPRQMLCFAGGLAYGAPEGLLLSTVCTVGGCAAGFGWARSWGREWVARRFTRARALLDDLVGRGPFLSVLTLRLLPVGSALLVNLGAGLSGIGLWPFLAATLIGSLPQNAIFVLMGAGIRIGHAGQMWMAVILFAASAGLGLVLMRRLAATKK